MFDLFVWELAARQLDFGEPHIPQRALSEGSATLAQASSDIETGTGGSWGGLPLPSILANVLSPKPFVKDSTVSSSTPPPNDPPSIVPAPTEVIDSAPGLLLNRVTGSSRGGPGSGGPRYLYGFVFNRYVTLMGNSTLLCSLVFF